MFLAGCDSISAAGAGSSAALKVVRTAEMCKVRGFGVFLLFDTESGTDYWRVEKLVGSLLGEDTESGTENSWGCFIWLRH